MTKREVEEELRGSNKIGVQGISIKKLFKKLEEAGIGKDETRIRKVLGEYLQDPVSVIPPEKFEKMLRSDDGKLLNKVVEGKLAIPRFEDFKSTIEKIFKAVESNTKGEMKDILPHPAPQRQPAFAVSICTVDGQLLQLGDHDLAFLLQSICKPVNYAIALEEVGAKKLHQHIGTEPGDESFTSSKMLDEANRPHNPMITSGAIMSSVFIQNEKEEKDRLSHVMNVWEKLTGNKKVSYNEESFKAEQKNANQQVSLAYLMNEKGAFPEDTNLHREIDFYLKCCAIEVNIDDLAHAAATFANYGTCPTTGEKIFGHDTVRDTLSLMHTSGMYDHSGQFAFKVGIPAKSGIAGGIMLVIPELMGIAIYSPPLDSHGNSVRGVEFCEKLVEVYNLHKFDALGRDIHGKKDPRH